MNISLFENIRDNYPEDKIICINNFDYKELNDFIHSINCLINSRTPFSIMNSSKCLNEEKIILTFSISDHDIGIIKYTNKLFICLLSIAKYFEMIQLTFDLLKRGIELNYQWLYDLNTPIDLLLSKNSKW